MVKIWNSKIFWEVIGYITLACCVFGQITVGTWYLLAQSVYLFSNGCSIVRDFALKLPTANIVRDVAFSVSLSLL